MPSATTTITPNATNYSILVCRKRLYLHGPRFDTGAKEVSKKIFTFFSLCFSRDFDEIFAVIDRSLIIDKFINLYFIAYTTNAKLNILSSRNRSIFLFSSSRLLFLLRICTNIYSCQYCSRLMNNPNVLTIPFKMIKSAFQVVIPLSLSLFLSRVLPKRK